MKRGSRKRKNASFDRRKGRKREILYKEDRSVKKATKGAQGKGAQDRERLEESVAEGKKETIYKK